MFAACSGAVGDCKADETSSGMGVTIMHHDTPEIWQSHCGVENPVQLISRVCISANAEHSLAKASFVCAVPAGQAPMPALGYK